MASKHYRLRPLAYADLEEIYEYSFHTFGEARAVEYVSSLERGFESLVDNPHLGKSRGDISDGLRALQIQSHYAFYRVVDSEIVVVRVLHTSRDYVAHL